MHMLTATLGVIFGLALLAALSVGVYWSIELVIDLFTALGPELAAATGIVSIVLLLAAFIVANGIRRPIREVCANQLVMEKATIYAQLVGFWVVAVRNDANALTATTENELASVGLGLALHADTAVSTFHTRLCDLLAAGQIGSADARSVLLSLLLAVRGDLLARKTTIGRDLLNKLVFPAWVFRSEGSRYPPEDASTASASARE